MNNNKLVEIHLEVVTPLVVVVVNQRKIFLAISHNFSIWEAWAVLVERESKKDRISS